VPDGTFGPPLTIAKELNGDLTLSWSDSRCACGDFDYGVYVGTLGDYTSHNRLMCTTGGATTATIGTADSQRQYYLIVPHTFNREGHYGFESFDVPREQGLSACLEQAVGTCPF